MLMKWKEPTLSLSSCKNNNAEDIQDWDGSFHDTKKLTTNASFRNTKKGGSFNKKEVYRTSWADSVFKFEHKVKIVERAYALNKNKEECYIFFFFVL